MFKNLNKEIYKQAEQNFKKMFKTKRKKFVGFQKLLKFTKTDNVKMEQ